MRGAHRVSNLLEEAASNHEGSERHWRECASFWEQNQPWELPGAVPFHFISRVCLLVWRSQQLVSMQALGDTFLSLSKSDVCGAQKWGCLQSYWPKSRDAGIASSDELLVPCLLFSTGASPSCIRRKCQEKWNNRQCWSNLLVDGSLFPVLESQLLNSVVLLCLSDPRCSRAVFPGRSLGFHTALGWTRPVSSPPTRFKGVGAVTASRHQLPPADPQGPLPACESSGPGGGAGQAPGLPAGALPLCWKAAPQTGKHSYDHKPAELWYWCISWLTML